MFVALAIIAIAIAGSACATPATTTNFDMKNLAPSLSHIFGTDWLGRDMFSRTLSGLRLSIFVGCLSAAASSVIAVVLGCVSATSRQADAVVCWLIDLMMGVPHIILLVLITYALGRGTFAVCAGIALTHWASLTRVIRAEVLQCRASEYVKVSRQLGTSWIKIARRHMLPYILPQFIVGLILAFPHAILHEAAITFLGFGLDPETPAIGVILSESMTYLSAGYWWLAVFPGLALITVVGLFGVCGKNLRALVDPHTAQR